MLPRVFRNSADTFGWLHRQGPGENTEKIPVRDPGGRRHGVVWQAGQGLHQATLPITEERGQQEILQ